MKKSKWLAAGAAAMLVFACASQKEPAEQAVGKIDNQLSGIRDAAQKYDPEGLKTADSQLASLKQGLTRGDYKGVLANAPAVRTTVSNLKQEVDSKQAEADAALAKTKQEWRNLNTEVPKMVADIHTQVDTLSKTHKYPKGVTKKSFESAQQQAASLDSMWADANSAVSNQDYAQAVTKGQAVKDKATEVMRALGMKTT